MCVNAKRSSTKVKTTTYHFLFYFCSKNPDRGSGFANISILVSKRQFFLCFCIVTSRNTLARSIMIASANDVRRQKAWDRNFKGSDKSRTSGYISILWPWWRQLWRLQKSRRYLWINRMPDSSQVWLGADQKQRGPIN